jgi:hypothetical protein
MFIAVTPLAHLALIGWVPLVMVLFTMLPWRRAVIASFILGWLFLPVMGYPIQGLPEYDKMLATSCGAFLGLLVFNRGRALLAFRPHWLDLPMLVWCFAPLASSISNGLGVYDGLSQSLDHIIPWGLPYLIARVTLTRLIDLRDLAIGIVMGALLYVPLCLYEVRMSPQLHHIFYGFYQHSFVQTMRMGGWRPMVFMDHGLMVSMFMSMATLIAIWLWHTKTVPRLGGIPIGWIAIILLITAVLCKSAAAMGLLALGLITLAAVRLIHSPVPLIVLVAMPPGYLVGRSTGLISKELLVPAAGVIAGEPRAQSLAFRLEEEAPLYERAMQRPIFGWGGWNRSRKTGGQGSGAMQVTDSLWIVALGQNGLVGLTAVVAVLLLTPVLAFYWIPIQQMTRGPGALVLVLALVCVLYMIDCLLNAMINPIYVLGLGGIATQLTQRCRRPRALPARAAQPRNASLSDAQHQYGHTHLVRD